MRMWVGGWQGVAVDLVRSTWLGYELRSSDLEETLDLLRIDRGVGADWIIHPGLKLETT